MNIIWEKDTECKFKELLEKIPVFMRSFAEEKVSKRIKIILEQDQRAEITEKDLVDAFFKETPFGFHGPMKTDMNNAGIDYTKYGYK
ncbi:MAG: DUF2621 family protein [Candidatus Omnitrophica bacterium]|nr:DUF2621 family protein [Candidatus Omnitrophota bacterium]